MPIYEYRCRGCGRKFSVLVRNVGVGATPACTACHSGDTERLISSFAYHKSEATRLAEAGSPDSPGPDYYKDPRNIGRWAEKRLAELGQEVPPEVKDLIGKAREGELPEPLKSGKTGLDSNI
jgi:putative FmdB family regulatory protein